MNKKQFLILFLIFFAVASFFGFYIQDSINVFFTWILVGTWIIFSVIFIRKIREKQEFNSPHNTPFFLFGPLAIGFFYSFWSYFTGFLGWNLLENYGMLLHLSPWTLFFGLPYLLYGLYIIRSCFKKFNVVYLIKNRSVGARNFGTFYIIMILFGLLFYLLFNNSIMNFFSIIVVPINQYSISYSLTLWIIGITSIYFIIRHSILGRRRSIPEITSDYIVRRRNRIESISNPTTRTTRSSQSISSSRPRPRRQPTRSSRTTTRRKPKASKPSSSAAKRKAAVRSATFEKLKPKAGILSLEDFKCIFCFKLPSSPSDDGRGIILCPKCRHPAHADEFKEWLQSSKLCSRCDAPIPLQFRQNPKIIPVNQYVKIIEEFKRRK